MMTSMFPTMFQIMYSAQVEQLKKAQAELQAEKDMRRDLENRVCELESQLKDETERSNNWQKECIGLAEDVRFASKAYEKAEKELKQYKTFWFCLRR